MEYVPSSKLEKIELYWKALTLNGEEAVSDPSWKGVEDFMEFQGGANLASDLGARSSPFM